MHADLDFAFEGDLDVEAHKYASRYGCDYEVLAPVGPSGHPVVRFTGAPDDLSELLIYYRS